jgi:predicted metalloprotease with PDZ domain
LPIPGAEITFQTARVRRFLDSGGSSLDGRVVDADTDKAVGDADIEAWMGTRSVEAETDNLGRFRFEGLIPGSRLTLWITSAPTYVQERTEVVVPEQQQSFQATFRLLDRATNPGAVDGGAGLFLSRRGNRTVVTGLAAFGPAERAGIRVNDTIVAVGKRKVLDLGPGAIDYLLRGHIGSQVELTVQTGSEASRKVLLQRSAR